MTFINLGWHSPTWSVRVLNRLLSFIYSIIWLLTIVSMILHTMHIKLTGLYWKQQFRVCQHNNQVYIFCVTINTESRSSTFLSAVADLHSKILEVHRPSRSNCLHYHAIFNQFWPINRLATSPPPREILGLNPGSIAGQLITEPGIWRNVTNFFKQEVLDPPMQLKSWLQPWVMSKNPYLKVFFFF